MSIPRAITGISKADSALSAASQPPPTLTVPSDPPTASSSAVEFLKKLNKNDIKYSVFNDELITFNDVESQMGIYQVHTQQELYKGENAVRVYAKSDGKIDNVFCCTELTAYIGQHLETLYQDLYEIVKLDQGTLERHTVIELTPDGLKASKTVKQGEKVDNYEKLFENNVIEGYISEGANILLQRIVVIKGLPDFFDVISFDSDTNLCLCTYKDLVSLNWTIADKSVLCFGIERKIFSLTDIPVTWHCYLLTDGHLITRSQIGSPIVMKVTEIPDLMEHDEYLDKPSISKKDLDWKEDMQLTSLYDTCKTELKADYQNYCRANPDLQNMMSDFLQAILEHKPDNSVEFASNYFSSFSNRFLLDPPIEQKQTNAVEAPKEA